MGVSLARQCRVYVCPRSLESEARSVMRKQAATPEENFPCLYKYVLHCLWTWCVPCCKLLEHLLPYTHLWTRCPTFHVLGFLHPVYSRDLQQQCIVPFSIAVITRPARQYLRVPQKGGAEESYKGGWSSGKRCSENDGIKARTTCHMGLVVGRWGRVSSFDDSWKLWSTVVTKHTHSAHPITDLLSFEHVSCLLRR